MNEDGVRLYAAGSVTEAYGRLDLAQVAHASCLARRSEAERALEGRAQLILGSIEAAGRFAGAFGGAGAAEGDEGALALRDRRARAEAELRQARAALEAEQRQALEGAEAGLRAAAEEVRARLAAMVERYRPQVELEVAVLGGGLRIVQVIRPSRDDAAALCFLLHRRAPARHDYLEDDSVAALGEAPQRLYPAPGVDPAQVAKAGEEALWASYGAEGEPLLLARAHLPVPLPGLEWPRLRLMARGPVLILEAWEPGTAGFTERVSEQSAELFMGLLLALEAAGRLLPEVRMV